MSSLQNIIDPNPHAIGNKKNSNNYNDKNKGGIEIDEEDEILEEDEITDNEEDADNEDESYLNKNNDNNSKKNSKISIDHIVSPNNNNNNNNNNHTQSPPLSKTITHIPASSSASAPSLPLPMPPQVNGNVTAPANDSLELLRENRELRKKLESMMSHNVQLMLGIKDRDQKISRQKRLLVKYRKALLKLFEENESPSSGDDFSSGEFKPVKKDVTKLNTQLNNLNSNFTSPFTPSSHSLPISITSPITTTTTTSTTNNNITPITHFAPRFPTKPVSASPPSPSYQDVEDIKDDVLNGIIESEHEFDSESKKRKSGGEIADFEPKKKSSRRNVLWTPEDDEMFIKIYSVYGKSWKAIHNYMPGKTREQVQSHGQYLIRIGKLEDVKTTPQRGSSTRKEKKEKEKEKYASSSSASSTPTGHQYPHIPQVNNNGYDEPPVL